MLKIYLTNLGKYNEGELVGEWVKLPVSVEQLEAAKKRIGINEEYEDYFITDYETNIEGLKIDEYENLENLNELAEQLENLSEEDFEAIQAFLLNGSDFKEALENTQNGNYRIYCDCEDMEDVACQVVEECEYLANVPETVARYFDYEAFGRDLDIEGTFYQIDNDIIQLY